MPYGYHNAFNPFPTYKHSAVDDFENRRGTNFLKLLLFATKKKKSDMQQITQNAYAFGKGLNLMKSVLLLLKNNK